MMDDLSLQNIKERLMAKADQIVNAKSHQYLQLLKTQIKVICDELEDTNEAKHLLQQAMNACRVVKNIQDSKPSYRIEFTGYLFDQWTDQQKGLLHLAISNNKIRFSYSRKE